MMWQHTIGMMHLHAFGQEHVFSLQAANNEKQQMCVTHSYGTTAQSPIRPGTCWHIPDCEFNLVHYTMLLLCYREGQALTVSCT